MCAPVCLFYYSFLFVSGGQERPGCCRRWPGTGSIPKLRSSRPDSGPTMTRSGDTSSSSASPSDVSYSVSYRTSFDMLHLSLVSRGTLHGKYSLDSVLRIWIRDQGSDAFLAPGSGMGKKSRFGSGMKNLLSSLSDLAVRILK